MSVAEDRGAEWAPAPGSVARHNWPLPARCAWWLAHRPSLVALVALAVVVGVELGPLVLAAAVTVVAVVLAGWWQAHPAQLLPLRRPSARSVALPVGLRGPVAHRDDALGARWPVRRR